MALKKIIITIPAYNEEKTIGRVIEDIKRIMGGTKYKDDYKILVVNDGSTDETAEIAKKAGALVYSHPINYGLAETFRTEIKLCLKLGADVIIHTDADGQYLASEIPVLIKNIESGYDLVLGSRFKGKIEYMPLIKKLGNKAFSKVVSGIAHTKISDPQTGFRAFTRDIAEKINLTSTYTYTQEQVIRAIKEKFKVLEVPVYFAKRKEGKSKLMRNPFHYAISAGINLVRIYRDYQPIKFFGISGLFLIFIGLVIGLRLLYKSFVTSIPGFWDLHVPTLVLIAIFIIGGLQMIFFGLLADMKKGS